jgi:site-specific recombinase XerD
MARSSVQLIKQVKRDGIWKRYPVVLNRNGSIKANVVRVAGKEIAVEDGNFILDWYEGGKRMRKSVGKDAADAIIQRERKAAELTAASNGLTVMNVDSTKHLLKTAVADYLDEIKLTKKPKTLSAYTTAMDYLVESCTKIYVEDIERKDLLKFAAFLRDEKEQAPRSVHNKFENVMSFLKAQGIRGLMGKNDWPQYTEEEPEVYEHEELDTLFAACDAEERLWFEFFLMTGMREQEVMHVYWTDVNFKAATVKVTHKPDYNWTPKSYKERSIPVPATLIARLHEAKSKHAAKCPLVFPTAGCRPKLNFLDDLKAVVERAGLKPENFWLHKFRATYATFHLWNGTDLRTVQSWLGHSDMASTMRYLKPSRSQATRDKVNTAFSASNGQ